jgi:hypothetical protein
VLYLKFINGAKYELDRRDNRRQIMRTEPCKNCGELLVECACMRNKCIRCGRPVGNITFSICDDCWDIEFPPKTASSDVSHAVDDVLEIIKKYLLDNGYDGLWNKDGECGCEINDLQPCGGDFSSCKPGFKILCDCGEHDFHIGIK